MRKIIFMLFGMLLLCACEKEPEILQKDQDCSATIVKDENASFRMNEENGLIKSPSESFPFWARVIYDIPYGIPATDEYGIIFFYHQDTDDVTPGFDLLTFYDFAATLSEPSVEGVRWMKPGYPVPYQVFSEGKGAVPFWIITKEQVLQVYADNVITMAELENLPPSKGYAYKFKEQLRPFGGGAPNLGSLVHAEGIIEEGVGMIEDGQKFTFYFQYQVDEEDYPDPSAAKIKVEFRLFD